MVGLAPLVRKAVLGLAVLLASVPAYAGRPCVDNFSESGEWATGKSFRSWVEYEGVDESSGFTALGRRVALDGWLGLTASKDVGIIAAYQEDNGKKSPLNASFSRPVPGRIRVEVSFQLARGLRAPTAALREDLCKLLESAVPAEQLGAASGAAPSGIALRTANGDIPMTTIAGDIRKAGFGPVLLFFADFRSEKADARASSRRPVILVRSEKSPADSYLLVRYEVDDGVRSVKVGSAGSLIRMSVGGTDDLAPDEDWTIPFTTEQEGPGVWLVSPRSDLKSGEYGLWEIAGYGAASFGVD